MPLINVPRQVVPPNFNQKISTLGPTHWWKHDEASGNLADSGTAGGFTLTAVGSFTYQYTGPEPLSPAIDYTLGNNWFRRASTTMTYQSGSIMAIYDTDDFSAGTVMGTTLVQATNESEMLIFGFGSLGLVAGGNSRFGVTRLKSIGDYRSVLASTDITEPTPGTPEWHILIATCDGANDPVLWDNGVKETSPVITDVGSPNYSGGAGDWFGDMSSDAFVLGNGRYSSGTSNLTGRMCHFAIFDRVLTDQEIADLQTVLS